MTHSSIGLSGRTRGSTPDSSDSLTWQAPRFNGHHFRSPPPPSSPSSSLLYNKQQASRDCLTLDRLGLDGSGGQMDADQPEGQAGVGIGRICEEGTGQDIGRPGRNSLAMKACRAVTNDLRIARAQWLRREHLAHAPTTWKFYMPIAKVCQSGCRTHGGVVFGSSKALEQTR